MDIEQYLDKYDNYIRGLIYKRADSDYRDDAYQEVVMRIIQYKDKLDSLDTDAARCAYICKIAKHVALPQRKADKKLKTYGDFTASDDRDATDPEEWFLEDDTYCPDNQPDLAKRAWAEEIIDTNEHIKQIEKITRRIRNSLVYTTLNRLNYLVNKPKRLKQTAEYKQKNKEKYLEYKRKYLEKHREQIRAYGRLYKQRKKEQKNEQLRRTEQ